MLPSNHLSTAKEKNDFSTILAIPIDILDNNSESVNSVPIENLQISLTDGFFCLENENGNNVVNILKLDEDFRDQISDNFSVLQTGNEKQSRINTIIFNSIPSEKEIRSSENLFLAKDDPPDKYTCCKCDKILHTLEEYQDHLRWHKFQKKYKCNFCNSAYNIENNLKIHIALAHHKESDGTCPICNVNLKFQRYASMRAHLMVHQVEEVYSCSECKNEFDNEDTYRKHVSAKNCQITSSKKNSQLSLKCLHCKLDFKSSKELRMHISEHAKVKRIFMKHKKYNKTKILAEKKFPCSECGKSFIKQSLLDRHWTIHSGAKPYQCRICDRSFAQKSTLQIHYTKHSGIKPFSCTLCPAKFSQKGNLRVHIKKTHTINNEDEKTFRCPYCMCIFKRIASLNGHITKSHIDEEISPGSYIHNVLKRLKELEKSSFVDKESQQNYPLVNQTSSSISDDSDKACTNTMVLTENTPEGSVRKYLVNIKKVGDVRWFICNNCSKEFKKPSDLIRHMRMHTKERPFKCQQCKQAFSLKSSLSSHMHTHKKGHNSRNFKCTICEHKFMSLRKLNLHIWKHNLDSYPKYQCLSCGFLCDGIEEHKDVEYCPKNNFDLFINNLMKTNLVQAKNGNFIAKLVKPKLHKANSESTSNYYCDECDLEFSTKINLKQHLHNHSVVKKHKCLLCSKVFNSPTKLEDHLYDHQYQKTYSCKLCSKKNLTWVLLQRHLVSAHNCLKLYLCPQCPKQFKTAYACRVHCRRIHKINITQMDIAVRTKNTPDDNTSVIYSVSKENNDVLAPLKPSASGNIVLQPSSLTTDSTRFDTNENISIEFNNATIFLNLKDLQILDIPNGDLNGSSIQLSLDLDSFTSLKSDENKSNEYEVNTMVTPPVEKNTKCKIIENNADVLKDPFKNKKHTLTPNKTVNKNEENKLTSIDNNFKLINIFDGNTINPITSSLELHDTRQMIFEDANIICMSCNKLFCSLVLFQNHHCEEKITENIKNNNPDNTNPDLSAQEDISKIVTNLDHNASEMRIEQETSSHPLKCCICEKIFPNKSVHSKHMKTHMKNQTYSCSICKKNINGRSSYIKHLRLSHSDSSGDIVRTCKHCSKQFKKPSDLARHLRIHTGEKPFICKICERRFALKSTLSSHEATHNPNHKRFNCLVCNSYFSSKSGLKVHMKIHSGQKLFDCYFCDMKFRTAAHRKSHVLLKHVSKRKKNGESKQKKIKNVLESFVAEVTNNVKKANKDNDRESRTALIDFADQILPMQQIHSQLDTSDNMTIASDQVTIDTISLLQHFQSSGMIITTDENNGVPSFLLNDITLLNLDPSKDNFQIIPMLDSEIQQEVPVVNTKCKVKNKEKQKCQICYKFYASKDVLRKHIKNVHCKNKFVCQKCIKSYDTQDSLDRHLLENHSKMAVSDSNYIQNQHLDLQMKKSHHYIMNPKEVPSSVLNMKFDLPSTNIEESLFTL